MPAKTLCLLFLTLSFLAVQSQSGYATYTVDCRANAKLFHHHIDNLGTILIDGYLKGKLRAYPFDVGYEVLKRKPIAPELIPLPWKNDTYYYETERVSYKGDFYEASNEGLEGTPGNGNFWQKIDILGEPVSTRKFFPTQADTLSKSEFLSRMITNEPFRFAPWDHAATYFLADRAEFEGKTYEMIVEAPAGTLPTNPNYWMEVPNSLEFYQPSMFMGFEILNFYQVENGDTILNPQMLSLLVNNIEGMLRKIGVSFYYSDVIKYLNSIRQPILYNQPLGYVGLSSFILDEENRFKLLTSLHQQIKSKKIKLKKNAIIYPFRFNDFLKDDALSGDLPDWLIHQDIISKDLIISSVTSNKFNISAIPVVKVPVKLAEQALKLKEEKIELYTYAKALANQKFIGRLEVVDIDSLQPFLVTLPNQITSNYSFLEKYIVHVDSGNTQLASQLADVWNLVNTAFRERKIKIRNPFLTHYPWQYDWTSAKIKTSSTTWHFTKEFSLGPQQFLPYDSLAVPNAFTRLLITYNKLITKALTTQFEPFEITFGFIVSRDDSFPWYYTVSWSDLKRLLLESHEPKVRSFIQSVETGKCNFSKTELVYGLIDNK